MASERHSHQFSLNLSRNELLALTPNQIDQLTTKQCFYYVSRLTASKSLLSLFLKQAIQNNGNNGERPGSRESDKIHVPIKIIQSEPNKVRGDWESQAQTGEILIVYYNGNWCAFEKMADNAVQTHDSKNTYFSAIDPILKQYLDNNADIKLHDWAIIRIFFDTRLEQWALDNPKTIPRLFSEGQEILNEAQKAAFRYAISCYNEPEDARYLLQAFQIVYDACPRAVIDRTKALTNHVFQIGDRAQSWLQSSQKQRMSLATRTITDTRSKNNCVLTPDYYANLCLIDVYDIHRQLWQYARLHSPENPQKRYNEIVLPPHRCDLNSLKQNCINLIADPNVIKLSPEPKIKLYRILRWCCETVFTTSENVLIQYEQQCYDEIVRHLQATRLSAVETEKLKPKLYYLQHSVNDAIAVQNLAQLKNVLELLNTDTLPSLEEIMPTLPTPTQGELLAASRAILHRQVDKENTGPEHQPAQDFKPQ